MYEEALICQKCHNTRTADLKMPCDSCGARSTIFGYLYQHEFRAFLWATVTIVVFIILAIIAGIIFFVYQRLLISGVSADSGEIGLVFQLIPQILVGGQA